MKNNKSIILCGSMKVKNKIFEVKDILESNGFNVLLPLECIKGLDKTIALRAHFNRIISNESCVLIVNEEKNGIENYIGPNSLCEIACSFYHNRKTFLLNDIYEPYKDELEAWGVIPLKANLELLNNYYKE